MADFGTVQPQGTTAYLLHAAPVRAAAAVAPVAASSGNRGSEARMDTAPEPPPLPRPKPRDETTEAGARPDIDEFTLIGPSPAFQANVLELERDLRRAIERLEAERSRLEAEAAFRIDRAAAHTVPAPPAGAPDNAGPPAVATDRDAPAPAPDRHPAPADRDPAPS